MQVDMNIIYRKGSAFDIFTMVVKIRNGNILVKVTGFLFKNNETVKIRNETKLKLTILFHENEFQIIVISAAGINFPVQQTL